MRILYSVEFDANCGQNSMASVISANLKSLATAANNDDD